MGSKDVALLNMVILQGDRSSSEVPQCHFLRACGRERWISR